MTTQKTTGGKLVWVAALGGFVTLCSPFLAQHLGKWESGNKPTLTAYADKLAGGLPTVCKGITRHVTTTPIVVGETWSADQCEREELAALERVQRQLLPCFKVLPPPSVLDMASSHAWNFGAGATCGSGAMAAWNRSEWERGCQRISKGDDGTLVWSFVSKTDPRTGKKVYTFVQGLANRRQEESTICREGL